MTGAGGDGGPRGIFLFVLQIQQQYMNINITNKTKTSTLKRTWDGWVNFCTPRVHKIICRLVTCDTVRHCVVWPFKLNHFGWTFTRHYLVCNQKNLKWILTITTFENERVNSILYKLFQNIFSLLKSRWFHGILLHFYHAYHPLFSSRVKWYPLLRRCVADVLCCPRLLCNLGGLCSCYLCIDFLF